MKNSIVKFIFFAAMSVLFTSCGEKMHHIDYRLGKDGLIYNDNNNQPYTGTITDTVDVVIQFEVVNGKQNGLFKTYYLNGQVQKFGYMINNHNVGEWKYYYPNGKIESHGNFENNMAEGKWIYYYQSGIIKCEGNYRNGKKEGAWTYYNEDGKIVNILIFQSGNLEDSQRKYT